jgi:DMSO/TMAO reductase YedYZ heme-binding membrane subunit
MGVLLWLSPVGDLREELGYALRVSARFAFFALLLAYIARPWQQLTGSGRWLLRHRRYFGLAAALTHTVHFGYIVALYVLTDEVLEAVTAVFGGLAYVMIWFMALTSNRASQQRLGTWWSRLHRFGMHYLWLIFMQSFAGRAIAEGDSLYVAIAAAGLAALMLRIAASLRQRFRRTA